MSAGYAVNLWGLAIEVAVSHRHYVDRVISFTHRFIAGSMTGSMGSEKGLNKQMEFGDQR